MSHSVLRSGRLTIPFLWAVMALGMLSTFLAPALCQSHYTSSHPYQYAYSINGINNKGQIVDYREGAGNLPGYHAEILDFPYTGSSVVLSPDANQSIAYGINDNGEAVGNVTGNNYGIFWDAHHNLHHLFPEEGYFGKATAISNTRFITGREDTFRTDPVLIHYSSAFRVQVDADGNTLSQVLLPGLQDSQDETYGNAVNNLGDVAGWSVFNPIYPAYHPANISHAVVWDRNGTHDLHLQAWSDAGYTDSEALGINDAGWIVLSVTDGSRRLAFLYKGVGTIPIYLGDDTVYAAINNLGQVVGGGWRSGAAWIWQNGVTTDLRTLADYNGDFAKAISDAGQIATSQYILTPDPVLTSVSPGKAAPGSGALTLTLTGSFFLPGYQVKWNGATNLATTYVNSTTLQAQVPAGLTASPGTATLTVLNIAPAGATSNGLKFDVGTPHLVTTVTGMVRDASGLHATVRITNDGTAFADSVQVTGSQLNSKATTTSLPRAIGTINAGSAVTLTLDYPALAGAPGTAGVLKVNGTQSGLTFSGSLRVALP